MNAAELGTKAAQARAAYAEAARKVALGERDAPTTSALAALSVEVARLETEARRQEARETWTEWRPAHAKHVVGRWNRRVFDDDGLPEEQTVAMVCEHCKAEATRQCSSGLVQQHVQRFAIVHLHRDVFHVRPRKVE